MKRVLGTKSRCERGKQAVASPVDSYMDAVGDPNEDRLPVERPSDMMQRLRHNNKHGDMVCPRCLVTWISTKRRSKPVVHNVSLLYPQGGANRNWFYLSGNSLINW